MNLKAFLFDEDRGVSPVIGVILMVAITVILAAVIATFVMNMGPSENTQPNVQWEWNNESSSFTLAHTGGEAATVDEFTLSVTDSSGATESVDLSHSSSELTASDEVTLGFGSGDVDLASAHSGVSSSVTSGDLTKQVQELELIWNNPGNDETQSVTTFDG